MHILRYVVFFLALMGMGFAATYIVNGSGAAAYCLSGGAPYAPNGTIQDAIDSASGGDTIIICRNGTGNYLENVIVNKSVSIYGNESFVSIIAATTSLPVFSINETFVNMTNLTATGATSSAGVQINATSGNVRIWNVNASGNSYGFRLVAASSNNLSNNTANGNSAAGISLASGSENNTLEYNTIQHSTSTYAIQLSSNRNNFTSNVVYNITTYSIFINGHNNTFTGNTFNNSWYGPILQSSDDNVFTSNTMANNENDGIQIQGSDNNNISSNTIRGNFQIGINIISGSINNRIYSNSIINHTNGTASGIFLQSINVLNHIYDNLVIENNTYGIYLNQSNLINLTGNTLTLNSYGIYLNVAHRNNLTSNNASRSTQDGFTLVGSANNSLVRNVAESDTSNAFSLTALSDDNNLTLNNATGSSGDGFNLSQSVRNVFSSNRASGNLRGFTVSSDNNTLTGNMLYNNSQYGIFLNNSDNNISSNTIYNNTDAGIYLTGSSSSGNRIFSNIIYNHTTGFASGIFLDGVNAVNHIYNHATLENNTYGIYANLSNQTNITSNTASNNRYGFAFRGGTGNNLTSNTANNNSWVQYQLETGATATFTGNNFAYNTSSGALVFNISGGSSLTTVSSYNITTDQLSLSFSNLENLSMVTSFISGTGVQEDRCGSASYSACRLVSELVNFSAIGTGRADSVSVHYNASKTGGAIGEDQIYVGQWGDAGWSQLGRTGIDTGSNFVTYGPLTSFSYYGAVGFASASSSSTSGTGSGATDSLTISDPELTCPDNTVTFTAMSGSEEVDGFRIRVISDASGISEGEDTTDSNGEATIELTRSGNYHTSTVPASGYASPDEVQFSFTTCEEGGEVIVTTPTEEEEVTPPTTTPPTTTPPSTGGEVTPPAMEEEAPPAPTEEEVTPPALPGQETPARGPDLGLIIGVIVVILIILAAIYFFAMQGGAKK